MPRTYLFALTDGGGTVPPEVGAARRLVERGHRARVLAEDSMAPEVRATGATFVPWPTAPNRPDRDPANDPLRDWEAPSLLAQARDLGDRLIAGPAPRYARDVLAAVDDERPDLVVTSVFAFGAMAAAQSRGIPFDVLVPNVYALPAPGRTPFGAGLKPARGPLGRVRDRAVTALSTRVFDRYTRDGLNALRADLGLAPLDRSWEQLGAARRQLVMTSPAFDLPGPLPPNARYVGPVLDDPAWADDAPWSAPPWVPAVVATPEVEGLRDGVRGSACSNTAWAAEVGARAGGILPARGDRDEQSAGVDGSWGEPDDGQAVAAGCREIRSASLKRPGSSGFSSARLVGAVSRRGGADLYRGSAPGPGFAAGDRERAGA